MPFNLWGATRTIGIGLPNRPLGYILLLLYLAFFGYLLYTHRNQFKQFTSTQLYRLIGLCFLALLTSQLFSITITPNNQLPPLALARNPIIAINLLAAAPFLLAGVLLNPLAALIVGFFSGLGRALGQTHQFFDLFHFAFAALLAAYTLRQTYAGRVFEWLRIPVISGALTISSVSILLGLAALGTVDAPVSYLAALDLALSTISANFVVLLLEGAIGGLIVMILFIGLPQLRPRRGTLIPSPPQRSLKTNLLFNFVLFAVALIVILVAVVFRFSIVVSTQLVVNQMAQDANTATVEIPIFQDNLHNLLAQYSNDENLLTPDTETNEKALRQLFRTGSFYRRVLLVDEDQAIIAAHPSEDLAGVALTSPEKTAVSQALATNITGTVRIAQASNRNDEQILSFVVPITGGDDLPNTVLIGRVPVVSMNGLIVGLQGTVGSGQGFIVNEDYRIIAHPDPERLLNFWKPPEDEQRQIRINENLAGTAYQGLQADTNARELVYYVTGIDPDWTIVITVPYEVVLRLAFSIAGPLALVLIIATAVFYAYLAMIGRNMTRPITQLVRATQSIAADPKLTDETINTNRIDTKREDEIGQLSRAFYHMQRVLKERLEELSLLLNVTQDVSTSIDITHSMPIILKGVIRGTNGAGARAVVLNPSGGHPLIFGEGPAAKAMAQLDRAVMNQLRHRKELILPTRDEIRKTLQVTTKLPVASLMAIPLHSHDRFQGIVWLGYSQPRQPTESERNLLHTLSSQASVMVQNARLYATAEGGRRRLAAVLASTTDAVIVTDQTERVLLINPAMERLFALQASKVIGRPVADILKAKSLVEALIGRDARVRNLEIPLEDGRVFYTSASTIVRKDGQVLGRVAVLHDITHFKEIDEMKSDFVSTVSHDLRSPLTFMRGYATMLPMVGELTEKQTDYLNKIMSGVEQMSKLVDDLLDLGRIEAGVDMKFYRIEVQALLSDLVEEYSQHARFNGIALKLQIEPNLPHVRGDKALIKQALSNFVTNAIKYAPNSGEMTVKANRLNGEVLISVKDQGPGIPKEDQMRLFEKFYRVQQRGTEKIKGSGLGLAIVRSIAEKHGGRVWCESQVGKGSTFGIALPIPK